MESWIQVKMSTWEGLRNKVEGMLERDPQCFDQFIEEQSNEDELWFTNPVTGKSISKYGIVWIKLCEILDDLKKTSFIVEAIRNKKITPKRKPLLVKFKDQAGTLRIGTKTWPIFGDQDELIHYFEKLDLSKMTRPEQDTTYESWTEQDVLAFKLSNGMFHPRTGQSFQNDMKSREKYIENYAPELKAFDVHYTLKRTNKEEETPRKKTDTMN